MLNVRAEGSYNSKVRIKYGINSALQFAIINGIVFNCEL